MIYNKITLAFPEKEEKQFLEQYFLDSLFLVRLALVLVSILYGIFGFLDTMLFPEYAKIFHIIRFFYVIPTFMIVFLLSFTKIFHRIWQLLLFICLIIGGTGISVMIMVVPDNYIYYAGMMLIFSASYFFVKLRFFIATVGGWAVLLIYNLGVIFIVPSSSEVIINTNFFFISANIIGMFAAYSIEFYARRNFFLNRELDKEKSLVEYAYKNLEKAVEERTNELIVAKEIAETNSANVTAIIEGNQNSIWAFDRNYNILYINQVFQAEFQQSFGVWLVPGVNLIKSLPEILRPIWKPRYDRVLSNEHFTIEDAIETNIGIIYIQISFTPIVIKGGVVGGSCFGSNITDRKLSEIELIKAKEKAEESDRLKTAFLANMSHEIRTPMNGILGFSELLKNPELTGNQQHHYLSIIEKSGARMLNILNDIIDISRIEAGLIKLNIGESNINEKIEYIYNFFKPEAEATGITLSFNTSLKNNEAIIYSDPEKIYAILSNLVKNAIKYCQIGEIKFGYTRKGEFLEFYVKDTGIGIPKDRQEAVFERFVQADISDKMARQGAGLGLSISKAFVEMLGGKIWVESEEGSGSTFYFTLPYSVVPDKTESRNNLPDNKSEGELVPDFPGLKILIAEDDATSELYLEIIIKKLGKSILKAKTGIETVEVFRNNPDIDLILMDIQMPGMDGYEATRQIRKLSKEVVIIAQTAFGFSGNMEKAMEAGCNDFITKPINRNILIEMLQKHINQ